MKRLFRCLFTAIAMAPALHVHAVDPASDRTVNPFLQGTILQIPGPNPILIPGEPGSWDGGVVETGDAFKDFGTYYLYYHATGAGDGYQTGVATARRPLGPFTKHGDAPILKVGPAGSWESKHVACAMILKEAPGKYLMWYSGMGQGEHEKWGVGLATADSPLGPWTKHPDNPILDHFGYVGGVVKVGGKYMLYTAHPIDSVAPDYSPMSLATADRPEGPYAEAPGNPILVEGEKGEWDDGGFSEAEVFYASGLFHMFYGGARTYEPRILTRESIGYAYSDDGLAWTKYGGNPIATREADPNAAAFAEVHAIYEPPFVYLYHTLRYKQAWRDRFRGQFPVVEDLGVQVLVTQRPFKLDVPVIHRKSLAAGESTQLVESPNVCLSSAETLSVTVACQFDDAATGESDLLLHVRSSADGLTFDTVDLATLTIKAAPGETVRQTFPVPAHCRFVKVLAENLDRRYRVENVEVVATIGG
ncbi:hypothetical protein OAS39_10485 [Pirellulales bacterium]|nr:hypothetical protein [Pirellulales bacterium]